MFVATISLIDCLIGVYTDFNSISDFHSYHNDTLHYSWVFWVSPVLGWGSEVSCPRTLSRKKKKKRIQCSSNTGPLDYESKSLPLSQAGPLATISSYRNAWIKYQTIHSPFFVHSLGKNIQ